MPEARSMSQGFFAAISEKIYTIFAATNPNRMAGSLTTVCQVLARVLFLFILGDPGAVSRDDGIFMGESLQQERESPWELTLPE